MRVTNKLDRVLIYYFQASLICVGSVRLKPRLCSCVLNLKYWTKPKRLVSDKHSSLFCQRINDNFYDKGCFKFKLDELPERRIRVACILHYDNAYIDFNYNDNTYNT